MLKQCYSVTKYTTKTATLTLEHNHPVGNLLQAHVDVALLVATMKSNESQIGEWLNVMGYVMNPPSKETGQGRPAVYIQAIMLWSAGSFNLKAYEMSLDQHKASDPC